MKVLLRDFFLKADTSCRCTGGACLLPFVYLVLMAVIGVAESVCLPEYLWKETPNRTRMQLCEVLAVLGATVGGANIDQL